LPNDSGSNLTNEVLHSEEWSFELIRKSAGNLELRVLCGTTGLYEVRFTLTPEESEQWKLKGLAFLNPWIKEIQANPSKYVMRSNP